MNLRILSRFALILTLLTLTFGSAGVRPAYAAGYTVNSTADNTNAGDGFCTLREAIQSANNAGNGDCGANSSGDDTITFDPALSGGTISLSHALGTLPAIVSGQGTLKIDGDVNGDGTGDITISGNNSVRVMWVNSGADLTLQNITIANGSDSGDGGGIYNQGTLTVKNSTFSNNRATGSGGGISNAPGGTLNVTNSSFSANRAIYGGGIDNNNGTLNVTNSSFSGNSAYASGGGIHNAGTLNVTDSTFANNSARTSGGGIYNFDTLNVISSTFSGNSAESGGGIYNDGTSMTVSGSTFDRNSAIWGGGGIDNNNGTLNVTNSTFSGNIADGYGGGIANFDTLNATNSTFSANGAGASGGGIFNTGTATLKNTLIANSTNGGDCVIGGGSVSGNNNLIEDNTNACGLTNGVNGNIIGSDPNLGPLTGSPGYFPLNLGSPAIDAGSGGPVCPVTDQRGVTRPQDGDDPDAIATCDIGSYELTTPAHYVVNTTNDNLTSGDALCTLREAIQSANSAGNGDCGADSSGDDTITFASSLSGGTISLALGTLPAIMSGQGALTIDGTGRNITISGGGSVRVMYVNGNATLILQSLTIANGNSSGNGGGIVNFGTLTVSNSTFSANGAGADGGGIYNSDTLNVTNSTFSGNSATNNGGGIHNASGSTLNVTNSTFDSNLATVGGGIVNSGMLNARESTFILNRAIAGDGGGISNAPGGTLNVTDSTFDRNSASIGGGISSAGMVTVWGSTFDRNSATWGGGIDNTGTLNVTNSTFDTNLATAGGGIDNFNGTLNVEGSTFILNQASSDGGGIYNNGTLNVTNSTFDRNGATNNGGGISSAGTGTLMVINSTFSANDASVSGGGIYVDAGTLATLKNTLIANSTNGDCVKNGGGSVSGNNNLIKDSTNACGLSSGSNILGQDPNLGPLTGSPAYFPLNPGSPAIDAGEIGLCPFADQRGVARPQDGDNNGTSTCDIGSYEAIFPDLTTTKSNDAGGAITLGNSFTWTVRVANRGSAAATFTSGQTILRDDLPSGATYGSPTVQNPVNVTNSSNISCTIAGNVLTCTASGGPVEVVLNASSSFDVVFTVTPTAVGTLTNPASGGICRADPNSVLTESDESNNCAPNTVTVNPSRLYLPLVLRN